LYADLRGFFMHFLIKHKWIIIGIAGCIVLLGMIQAYSITPIYRASTLLEIAAGESRLNNLTSRINTIRSRVVAERVIKRLDIDDNPGKYFLPRRTGFMCFLWRHGQDAPEDLAGSFLSGLSARVIPGKESLEVSYESPSAQLAARLLNAAIREYLELHLEREYEATHLLEKQIREQQRNLEQSEQKLLIYFRKYVIHSGKAAAAKTAAIQRQYRALKQEVEAGQKAYDRAMEQIRISLYQRPDQIRVVQAGSVPTAPFYPVIWKYVVASLGIGLVLGIVAAFIRSSVGATIIIKQQPCRFYPWPQPRQPRVIRTDPKMIQGNSQKHQATLQ
jgi:uncharacterized protein involved in exopolysaccharide biosynthesis